MQLYLNKVLLSCPGSANIFQEFPISNSAVASEHDSGLISALLIMIEMNGQNIKQPHSMIYIYDYPSLNFMCMRDV